MDCGWVALSFPEQVHESESIRGDALDLVKGATGRELWERTGVEVHLTIIEDLVWGPRIPTWSPIEVEGDDEAELVGGDHDFFLREDDHV